MRHIIPISGKDSLATALIQRQLLPNVNYEYVFNPTGAELPEVFTWLERVELYLGKEIHRVGEDLFQIIEEYNFFLPSRYQRYCTRRSKIEPFEKWIGVEPATVYYGIRSDENRGGYDNSKYPNIVPAYPLKDEFIDINGVYKIINSVGLKPPVFFWRRLYDAVIKIVGEVTIKLTLTDWQRDKLFCWRTRANCYFCFNQVKSEWLGLHEHHPNLFWKSEQLEHSESDYYWNGKDYPLTKIIEDKDKIFDYAVKRCVRLIRKIQDRQEKAKQVSLFDLDKEEGFYDFFSQTSCGLFCGK